MTYTDDEVRELQLSQARQELLEELMATPIVSETARGSDGRHRPWWVIPAVAAAAVLIAVAIPFTLSAGEGDSPTDSFSVADQPGQLGTLRPVEGFRPKTFEFLGKEWILAEIYGDEDNHEIVFAQGSRMFLYRAVIGPTRQLLQARLETAMGLVEQVDYLKGDTGREFIWTQGREVVWIGENVADSEGGIVELRGHAVSKSEFIRVLTALEDSPLLELVEGYLDS